MAAWEWFIHGKLENLLGNIWGVVRSNECWTRFYGSILYYLSVYWVYLCAGMKHLYVYALWRKLSAWAETFFIELNAVNMPYLSCYVWLLLARTRVHICLHINTVRVVQITFSKYRLCDHRSKYRNIYIVTFIGSMKNTKNQYLWV